MAEASRAFQVRGLRRVEYDRLVDLGMFEGERLELLNGSLVVGEPQGSSHAATVAHVARVLADLFGPGWHLRLHSPLALSEDSEPEPDIAVVAGDPRDFRDAHPTTAALVVEVADSSVRLDRRVKARIYARAGLADYWLVNLADGAVEVHRDPVGGADRGPAYRSVERLRPPATVAPLAAPAGIVSVRALLL